MNLYIPKGRSEAFVKGLVQFLETQLEAKAEYDQVFSEIFGTQNPFIVNREIKGSILAFDSKSLEGVHILFEVSEEQEGLSFFQITKIDEKIRPFLAHSLPSYNKPVKKGFVEVPIIHPDTNKAIIDPATKLPKVALQLADSYKSLAGFNLGDIIQLTEIDATGKKEASARLWDIQTQQPMFAHSERLAFEEDGSFYTPNEQESTRIEPKDMSFVETSSGKLGLRQFHTLNDGSKLYKVNSIESGSFDGPITDLCGLDSGSLQIKIGMKDTDL